MQILDDATIHILDDWFSQAQTFMGAGDYVAAYEKCDDLKRLIERLQASAIRSTTGVFIAAGIIAGLVAPGVGNVIGGIVGAAGGNALGRYLGRIAFKEGGTIEEIKELAIAGKQEAKAAQSRQHLISKKQLPSDAPVNLQSDSLGQRWARIRREVLGA